MFQINVIHTTLRPDLDDIYHRLAILHRALDNATYWSERLRLRAEIEAAQRDLVAILHKNRAQVPERSAPCPASKR